MNPADLLTKPKRTRRAAGLAGRIAKARADDDGDLEALVDEIGRHPELSALPVDAAWAAALYFTADDVDAFELAALVGDANAKLIEENR